MLPKSMHDYWARRSVKGGQIRCSCWSANCSNWFSASVEAVAIRIMIRAPKIKFSSVLSSIKIQVRTCRSKRDWKASGKFGIFLEGGMSCWLFLNSWRMKKKTLAMWFKKLDCWAVLDGIGIRSKAWRRSASTSREMRLWRARLRQGMAAMRWTRKGQSKSSTEPIKIEKTMKGQVKMQSWKQSNGQGRARQINFLFPLFENAFNDLVQVLFLKACTYIESLSHVNTFVNLCLRIRSTMNNGTPRGKSTEEYSWRWSRQNLFWQTTSALVTAR